MLESGLFSSQLCSIVAEKIFGRESAPAAEMQPPGASRFDRSHAVALNILIIKFFISIS